MQKQTEHKAKLSTAAFRRWLDGHQKHPAYDTLRSKLKGITMPQSIENVLEIIIANNSIHEDSPELDTGDTELLRLAEWALIVLNNKALYRILAPGCYVKVTKERTTRSTSGSFTRHYHVHGVDYDAHNIPYPVEITEEVAFLLDLPYDSERKTLKTDAAHHESESDLSIAIRRALYGADGESIVKRC